MRVPFWLLPHVHQTDARRLVSLRVQEYLTLRFLFPDNILEPYVITPTGVGWTAGGHSHHHKSEIFHCVTGVVEVRARWVDKSGQSFMQTYQLDASEEPRLLVVPVGIWHELICVKAGSAVIVYSSTTWRAAPHTDEDRRLPVGYDDDRAVSDSAVEAHFQNSLRPTV
jgi:dTDP-4-dehydrorhamnose 3,5-epimerase-like enzyme